MRYGNAMDIMGLEGRKALVTGGTKGIGKEIAICLMESGCDVFVTSRDIAPAEELKQVGEEVGRCCYSTACDMTDAAAVKGMVERAVADLGRIDILINCAGTAVIKFLEDMDEDDWDQVIDANLKSIFLATKEVVRQSMRPNGYGRILNLSSMKSIFGTAQAGYTAYCASKGGVNTLTKQLACELAQDHITANAIAPTFIKTAINAHLLEDEAFHDSLIKRIPVGRIGEFRDLMGLVLLLCSNASSFITGQIILLDGGISARQE